MVSEHIEHIVSVSGGKDSTALYLLALERMHAKGRAFRAVFADTGNEHEAVYDAIRALPILTGGPKIEWVSASFDRHIAKKRDVVNTKWRRDGVSEDVISAALDMLHPTGNAFLDLCIWKGRFPSTMVRFCTEELKVRPIQLQIYAPLFSAGKAVVSWQGVRGQESLARSLLPQWQRLEADGRVYAYRPLLSWTTDDVWAMHDKHGVPRNMLYNQGMRRVGCMPCIMSRKDELREIARRFPEHIERIAKWEEIVSAASKQQSTTFMSADAGDDVHYSTHGILERVEWSKTSRGGKQYDLDLAAEFGTACNQWGVCE
jgi:3'-phosphoadenosine 5'-phosphosulfate sulfotransferase (PAPS reductase)/FAD synthetase